MTSELSVYKIIGKIKTESFFFGGHVLESRKGSPHDFDYHCEQSLTPLSCAGETKTSNTKIVLNEIINLIKTIE